MTEPVFSARRGALYGRLGLPLAFLALPLYVMLPNHYAREFGVPLACWARCCWARGCSTPHRPLLGRLGDRLFARSPRACWASARFAAVRWRRALPACSFRRCGARRP